MINTLISTSEKNSIVRAKNMAVAELGELATAFALHDHISSSFGPDQTPMVLRYLEKELPVLGSLADESDTTRLTRRLSTLTNRLSILLLGKTNVVCVGVETAWLEIATVIYPDMVFHLIPHSQEADFDRLLSNYGENVRIQNSLDLRHLYGSSSIIISFMYRGGQETFYTYPVVHRICGSDTRQYFSDMIAIDLMDCSLKFYPKELSEISTQEMTRVLSDSQKSSERGITWKLADFQ